MNSTKQVHRGTKLTPKQKAYVDYKLLHPKQSDTKAVLAIYNTDDSRVATQIAMQNNRAKTVVSYLAKHSKGIEDVLTDNFYKLAKSDDIVEIKEGNRVGMWMHDKIHGTAQQSIVTTSTGVTINIDLTSSLELPTE